ncbi:DUF5658 family protein [Fuerstiella marisgermanici]|uniref:Uncharacterized protein n=1 Tax=Fuerstiella marisgermanici TaxID=1891926 RepID=A0A1P8WJ99_9PLAN|nr:DUF5658 family protein [Fuerstiella marisgermanici]APZ94107.1 hypothetical protein Fuma_03728 [Fuerstiella marisgermanici]
MHDALTGISGPIRMMLMCLSLLVSATQVCAVSPGPSPSMRVAPKDSMTAHMSIPKAPVPDIWTLDRGYLFVQGRYVPLGSEIDAVAGLVTLPAEYVQTVHKKNSDVTDSKSAPAALELTNDAEANLEIIRTLRSDGVVVCQSKAAPQTWPLADGGRAVLACLLDPATDSPDLVSDLPAEFQHPSWRRWLTTAAVTPDFAERAQSEVSGWTETISANKAQSVARQRLANFSYPLMLAGMVLVVLSFGQLLWFRPGVKLLAAEGEVPISPETATTRCIALLVMMSLLDLTMTLLAHQAHAMLEVNPIGNRIVSSVPTLISFKLGLTAFAATVLYVARGQKIGQLAAWWGCLILCLLTARWVMFNQIS